MAVPILLVDTETRITFHNRAAWTLLGRRDGLRARNSGGSVRLFFTDAQAQRSFVKALVACAAPATLLAPLSPCVFKAHKASGGHAYLVRIAPTRIHAQAGPRDGAHPLIVFISDPSARVVLDSELLACVYSLTAAEIRVAEALLLGSTLAEISTAARVRLSTTRSQLLSIFRKTGTTRQVTLMKLLMSLSTPA